MVESKMEQVAALFDKKLGGEPFTVNNQHFAFKGMIFDDSGLRNYVTIKRDDEMDDLEMEMLCDLLTGKAVIFDD